MDTSDPFEDIGPTTARDPLIGAQLGEYKVLSRLGEGAMGIVYRGEQPLLGKPVAIKVLQQAISADPIYVKKLLEEARAISAARHPNIIDIFSFGQAPTGQQYFVMECLEGDPLDLHLRQQNGRLEVDEVVELLQQMLAGLSAAHAAGVVHRDLKPSNIFLARLGDGSRFVKLLDFGLAKRTAPNSGVRPTANVIVGTALYMAPEQISTEEIGPWTDLYAVGCVAHELLTGLPPFPGAQIMQVLEAHARTQPTPLRQIDPSIPEALETLVLELLQKVPAHRPKSAAIVRKALERIERKLAQSPTRSTGLQQLRASRVHLAEAAVAPTRISKGLDKEPASSSTHISLPRTGPVPETERSTQLSKAKLAAQGTLQEQKGSRMWMVVVLAPLFGVGGYWVAKKIDGPSPIISVPATPREVVEPPVAADPAGPEPTDDQAQVEPVILPDPASKPKPKPKPATATKRLAATRHSFNQINARIQEMQKQAKLLGDKKQADFVAKELNDTFTEAGSTPASVDELWEYLDSLEAKYFRK